MKFFIVLAALIMVVSVGTAQAENYRYTDNQGLCILSRISRRCRKIPLSAQEYQAFKAHFRHRLWPFSSQRKTEETPTRQTSSIGGNGVELFVTSWCGYCGKMGNSLKKREFLTPHTT
jgi:hypothetical protein